MGNALKTLSSAPEGQRLRLAEASGFREDTLKPP